MNRNNIVGWVLTIVGAAEFFMGLVMTLSITQDGTLTGMKHSERWVAIVFVCEAALLIIMAHLGKETGGFRGIGIPLLSALAANGIIASLALVLGVSSMVLQWSAFVLLLSYIAALGNELHATWPRLPKQAGKPKEMTSP